MIIRLNVFHLILENALTRFLAITVTAVIVNQAIAEDIPVSTLGDNLRGEFTSASPINLNDGTRYSAHRFCAGNGNAMALYQFQGPFSARLSLIDENYNLIGAGNKATSDEGGLVLIAPPESQCVLLIVSGQNSNAYGPYQLNAVRAESAILELNGDESILAEADQNNDTTFPLHIAKGAELDMQLIDASGRLGLTITGDHFYDQAYACGDNELRLTTYLEPGQYQIALEPEQRPSDFLPEDECATVATTQGQAFYLKTLASPTPKGIRNGGTLTQGDEISGILGNGRQNEYRMTLDTRSLVVVNLASTDFDAVLAIQGPDGDYSNDDSGGSTDAEIDAILSPGDYRVLVQSLGDSNNGRYSLRARTEPFSDEITNGGNIRPGEQLTGLLSGDYNAENSYNLIIDERAEIIIDVASNDFSSQLILTGNGVTASTENFLTGYTSHLDTLLEPGTYNIQVSSAGAYGGTFTVNVAQAEAVGRQQDGGDVAPGDVVFGHMNSSEPLSYRLLIDSPRNVRISATSSSSNVDLTLSGGDVSLEGNYFREDQSTRIESFLTPGEYSIQVRDFGTSSATIRLEISETPAEPS